MHYFSIAWRILTGVATAAVIAAVFHIASSRFESIVVSSLVLIYVTVATQTMKLGYAQSRKWDIDLSRHIAIAKSVGLNTEMEEEAQKENVQNNAKGEPLFWIDVIFYALFGLMAVGNLLYAVMQ
jgi:hypothetical protein